MIKKIIHMEHHVDDYECMWNGIEDLYIGDTKETLPPSFFFILSGFGSFCYMKTSKAELKRMVALGDGRTKITCAIHKCCRNYETGVLSSEV